MLNIEKPKVVAIVGPTSSGKSGFAKVLAKKFKGRVISADSRQFYQGMDIGTGKDKSFEQDFIDTLSPDQFYSIAEFQKDALKLFEEYFRKDLVPFVVGGSGLYIEALLYGYEIPELHKESLKLRSELDKYSNAELLERLEKIDPVSAQNIDPKNKRRLIRALEVSILLNKPFSSLKKKKQEFFDFLIIGIEVDRETLYAKIDARVSQMIKDGLVEEVRKLLEKNPPDLPALNTIGYKEIIDYIYGKSTLKEATEKIMFNTHAYARRQITWFKRDKNIKWVKNLEEAEKIIARFLK